MYSDDPSGKFKSVAKGYLAVPGGCLACGNGTCEEGYVDLGTYIDYFGQAYLCYFCVEQIAEKIGCVIPGDLIKMEQAAAEQLSKNDDLTKQLGEANERLSAYITLVGTLPSLPVSDGSGSVPGGSDDEESADTPLDFEGSDDGEPVTEEPVKDPFYFGS